MAKRVRLERMRGTWKKFHFMNVFYRICADSNNFIYIYFWALTDCFGIKISTEIERVSRDFWLRHNFFHHVLLFFTLGFAKLCLFIYESVLYTSPQTFCNFASSSHWCCFPLSFIRSLDSISTQAVFFLLSKQTCFMLCELW